MEQWTDRCALYEIPKIGGRREGRERDDHAIYEHADWNSKLVMGNTTPLTGYYSPGHYLIERTVTDYSTRQNTCTMSRVASNRKEGRKELLGSFIFDVQIVSLNLKYERSIVVWRPNGNSIELRVYN